MKKVGRKTIMTENILDKLKQAFAFGATDEEACFFAEISPATLYNYQDKNPKFLEQKNLLKKRPILLARQEVVNGLKGNPDLALKFLERKAKKEFGTRLDLTTDDKPLNIIIDNSYGKEPKFRTDNNSTESNDLAENSSR